MSLDLSWRRLSYGMFHGDAVKPIPVISETSPLRLLTGQNAKSPVFDSYKGRCPELQGCARSLPARRISLWNVYVGDCHVPGQAVSGNVNESGIE